jgi:N,N-dimethylformamidase beta subunit-like protein
MRIKAMVKVLILLMAFTSGFLCIHMTLSQRIQAQNSTSYRIIPPPPHQFKTIGQEQKQRLFSSVIGSKQHLNIAFILPTFTWTAYNNSFYSFYKMYQASIKPGVNITHNLNLLSSKVIQAKSDKETSYLTKHLALLFPSFHVSILSDADVDTHSLFSTNGTNRYDAVILGHQEYVTQQEYNTLKKFVANGGTMILLDSNTFYALVGYDSIMHTITLIKGHFFAFNGRSAWKGTNETWANQSSQWVGSNFLCFLSPCRITFANNPFGYTHHEEQYLTNPNDTILLNYNASVLSPDPKLAKNATLDHERVIATYELNYGKGRVIDLGIYSDDIYYKRSFLVFFDHLLMQIRGIDN